MAYVTDLQVSVCIEDEEKLQRRGYTKVFVNIKEGTHAKNNVYLWYKKGDENPITRVQVTFNDKMEDAMEKAGYTMVSRNINEGIGGPDLYMWYSKATGDSDVPVVDVDVTVDPFEAAKKIKSGGVWEAVNCDLNLGVCGTYVYTWLKREKPIYIARVTATDAFELHDLLLSNGYTRVDVDTNYGARGSAVFIWYRKTTNERKSLAALEISTDKAQEVANEQAKFTKVLVNLNDETGGYPVYLWWKKENLEDMKAIFLLRDMKAVQQFEAGGITVIKKSLNTGNCAPPIYLCYA